MKDQLVKLVQKYDLKEIENRLELLNDLQVKIGFLGEFSSGKSSLINALLGEKVLPAMVKPTTKSIIEVEPSENIDARKFYKQQDDHWVEIKGSEFSQIALGEEEGTVKVETPSNDYLKKDFIFIDTPGISSLEEMDKDITYGYLPFLDGAVICQDIQQGSLTQSIVDFISDVTIRPIVNNFLFVLTRKDTKQDDDAQRILENVIEQLKKIDEEKNLGMVDIETKVSLVSSEDLLTQKDSQAIDGFKKSLEMNILSKFTILKREREEKEYLSMLQEVKNILEYRIDNMDLDNDALKENERVLKEDLEELEIHRKKVEHDLQVFRKELDKKLSTIVENHIPILKKVEDNLIGESIAQMHNELSAVTRKSISKYFNDIEVPALPSGALYGVESFIQSVNKAKDVTVMASTAIATAYIGGAGSVAGNAAEAGGGAAARTAGKTAAQAASKQVAKSTAKQLFIGLGKVIKDINPLEHIGEFSKQLYLDSALFDKLKNIAENMSFEVYRDIQNSLEEGVFSNLKNEIEMKQKSLELIRKEKKSGEKNLDVLKKEMFDDVLELKMIWANFK